MHSLQRSAPSATRLAAAAGVSLLAFAGTLQAQQDTRITRPIRMIVPYVPGGGTDTLARIVAPFVSEAFGQTVLVDNRPGASSTLGTQIVAQAVPDGHTIGMIDAAFLINPSLLGKLPYDTLKDFSPIVLVATSPLVLLVHPAVRASSVKELVALARAQPGKLTFGSAGNGSSNHLAGELLAGRIGASLLHVPYKGSAPALVDVLSGPISFMFDTVNTSTRCPGSQNPRSISDRPMLRLSRGDQIPVVT
jgi:tripartite-type tricarboxylate transporter receptor subunit TctC